MKQVEATLQWFRKRGPRERIYLFILGLFLIYAICMILFIHPQTKAKKLINDQMNDLKTKQSAMQQQIDVLNDAAKNGNLLIMLDQQKKLNTQIEIKQKVLANMKPLLVSINDVTKITKSILVIQNNNFDLIGLKDFPPVPWSAANEKDMPDIAKIISTAIYQRDLQIEFKSDYFNTIDYIKKIEKLPWPLYWDSLTYKVLEYPMADIIIKLHVLTV